MRRIYDRLEKPIREKLRALEKNPEKPIFKKDIKKIEKSLINVKGKEEIYGLFHATSNGTRIAKKSQLQKLYGCPTCLMQKYCEQYPHSNGGCSSRYMFFEHYAKQWHSDSTPLMMERAIFLEKLAFEQLEKDLGPHSKTNGEPSYLYLALQKMANEFHIATQKQVHGTKVNVSRDINFGDVRKKVFEALVNVTPEKKDGNSD